MRCSIDLEDIIKYAENQLSEEDNIRIREHLSSCEKCRRYFGVLTYSTSYARQDLDQKQHITAKVMDNIDVNRYKNGNKRIASTVYSMMPALKPLIASAAVFVALLLAFSNYQSFMSFFDRGNVASPYGVSPSATNLVSPQVEVSRLTTLYFGSPNVDGVTAEIRGIVIDDDIQLERAIFEELQKGPKTEGLHPVIPKGTRLLSVKTEGYLCTLNLSREFVDNLGGSAGENMTFYSIVNSLTELPEIRRVRFLIEGQKDVYSQFATDQPFERNEDFIKPQNKAEQTPSPGPVTEEDIRQAVEERGKAVIFALKKRDMSTLGAFIHPEKGVRFSPYAYVDIKNDQVFEAKEIPGLMKSKSIYTWGTYDGKGDPIKLTFSEYYEKFVYDQDFANPQEIGYNKIIGTGTTLNNIKKAYPEGRFIEYHFSVFNPKFEGMDWESLRLVFEEYKGEWYLVGIVHDQWTI